MYYFANITKGDNLDHGIVQAGSRNEAYKKVRDYYIKQEISEIGEIGLMELTRVKPVLPVEKATFCLLE